MPTLAEDPDETAHQELRAKLAASFGAEAARYDRTRPPYPESLIERIVAASPGPRVAEVGCGTGTLSRQLRDAGLEVLGVEHDEQMAAFARASGVPVELSKFEDWDPAGRVFDAVVAGQSWHWVDPDAGVRQAARALRPGGVFVALWHVFSTPDSISEALAHTYHRIAPDTPLRVGYSREDSLAFYRAGCERTAALFADSGEFSGPQQWSASWDHTYTSAEYADLIQTMGPMALLTSDQIAEFVAGVTAAVDAEGGSFTSNYETLAVAITRN
ncbi:class I SAM-dependent methyltransferase [Lentzea sp. NPDC006480]|uniref:class I SAM-dependent methyltransferase n=1 Tax=Lentzea sp. NPDC006480 TaxID=3157176 RepID=UPI0033AE4AFD